MTRGRVGRLVLVSAGLAACASAPGAEAPIAPTGWTRIQWSDGNRLRGSYRLLAPPLPVRGLLVLLDAPHDARLPGLLAARGIATIQPEFRAWTLWLDRRSLAELGAATADAAARLQLREGAVVLGGASLGGTGAVRYTQHCVIAACGAATPVAVFAVDAPLDMERLWNATNQVVQRGAPESNLLESRALLARLVEVLGGPPGDASAVYLSRSPFSYFAPQGGNARLLVDIPVRLYTEPDIDYWIRERRYDYYNINAFDAAALVNRLLILGNRRAELIVTMGRGYEPDGTRNPHSWSIVDEEALADWIERQLAPAR